MRAIPGMQWPGAGGQGRGGGCVGGADRPMWPLELVWTGAEEVLLPHIPPPNRPHTVLSRPVLPSPWLHLLPVGTRGRWFPAPGPLPTPFIGGFFNLKKCFYFQAKQKLTVRHRGAFETEMTLMRKAAAVWVDMEKSVRCG